MLILRLVILLFLSLITVGKTSADSFSFLLDYGVDSQGGEQTYLNASLALTDALSINAGVGESRQDTLVSPAQLDTALTETFGASWSDSHWQLGWEIERWGQASVLQTYKNGILLDIFVGDFTLGFGLAAREIRLNSNGEERIHGTIGDLSLIYHGIGDVDFTIQQTRYDYEQHPRDICTPLSSIGITDPCLQKIQLLQNAAEDEQQSLGISYYLNNYDFNFSKSKLVNSIDASTVWFNTVSLGTTLESLYVGVNYSWRENASNEQLESYGLSLIYQP